MGFEMKINFNVKKVLTVLEFVAKIVAFLSLTMSVVIKTRVLLGINTKTKDEDESDATKS